MKHKNAGNLNWLLLFLLCYFAISVPDALAEIDGAKLFQTNCTQCHSIGKGKLIGPDLKDAHKRVPSEEWMVPWIKNSQTVIKSGDAYAVKIFEEYNKTVMTAVSLNDEEILAVIEYIKQESSKEPVVAAGSGGVPGFDEKEPEKDYTTFYVLLAVSVVLILLNFVIGSVKKSLQSLVNEKKGLPPPPDRSFFEAMVEWMTAHKRLVALGLIILTVYGSKAAWDSLLNIGIEQGYEPKQPIWFSHKIHAGDNAINCVYCHSGAEKSKTAGIPSANVCMNCHKAIRQGTLTGTDEISKIYAAIDYDTDKGTYGNNPKPINWVKVHNLPDLAYFNHSQHVKTGKIECNTCHGPVEDMHVMRQESLLTMGWCVDCHRTTEVKMEGNPYYDELHEKLKEKYKGQKITVDKMGGIDCARCHY